MREARAIQSANERKRKRQHAVENGAKCGEREKIARCICAIRSEVGSEKGKMRTDREMQKATVERAVPEIPIDKRIYWILRNCFDAAAMAATATPGDAAAAKHIRIPISFDLFSLVSPVPPPLPPADVVRSFDRLLLYANSFTCHIFETTTAAKEMSHVVRCTFSMCARAPRARAPTILSPIRNDFTVLTRPQFSAVWIYSISFRFSAHSRRQLFPDFFSRFPFTLAHSFVQ